jgi:hypothetical protein
MQPELEPEPEPEPEPESEPESEPVPACERYGSVVSVTVLACRGLPKLDLFDKNDVYVSVEVNSRSQRTTVDEVGLQRRKRSQFFSFFLLPKFISSDA